MRSYSDQRLIFLVFLDFYCFAEKNKLIFYGRPVVQIQPTKMVLPWINLYWHTAWINYLTCFKGNLDQKGLLRNPVRGLISEGVFEDFPWSINSFCIDQDAFDGSYEKSRTFRSVVQFYKKRNSNWKSKMNQLFNLIFFLLKELHMTFFVSKFHGTGSISLGDNPF